MSWIYNQEMWSWIILLSMFFIVVSILFGGAFNKPKELKEPKLSGDHDQEYRIVWPHTEKITAEMLMEKIEDEAKEKEKEAKRKEYARQLNMYFYVSSLKRGDECRISKFWVEYSGNTRIARKHIKGTLTARYQEDLVFRLDDGNFNHTTILKLTELLLA